MNPLTKESRKKALIKLEDFWVQRSVISCIILGLISGILHYYGIFTNIREVTSNVVNFSSIVIGVSGVFLTLVVTLQESPVFQRLREFFPKVHEKLYKSLQMQIYYGLIVVILSILINMLPPAPYKILASFGVAVWFSFFWLLSLGAFYSIKLILDLVVRNFDHPIRGKRR